ncbi:DNA-directed RNA polymerase I subunit 2 [Tanacetum coccineum]
MNFNIVLLDGHVAGVIPTERVYEAVSHLRKLKLSTTSAVPEDLEKLPSPEVEKDVELIGPFEQVFMEIECPDGGDGGRLSEFPATHEEIHPTGILSVVGNLTPWSDHNQVTRNMHECQMAKQTMGFSSQAINCRADQKIYHLQVLSSHCSLDYCYKISVLLYLLLSVKCLSRPLKPQLYDMEDAIVLNKSSVDRGFAHGHIYQTESIDLADRKSKAVFRRNNDDKKSHSFIDSDGLPYVGQRIKPGEPYFTMFNEVTSNPYSQKLMGSEAVTVDYLTVDVSKKKKLIICVAMLLESIAAKGGSLHGNFVDATPFSSSVKKPDETPEDGSDPLINELGSMLTSRGFNHHGKEVLCSGIYGTELTCEIQVSVILPKYLTQTTLGFQVRSTGTVDQVTRQPIKGGKNGGGIRFGEMERDSLLAHGAAYLLHDRLHSSSNHHISDICSICGSILTTSLIQHQKKTMREVAGLPPGRIRKKPKCISCDTSEGMETVAMPYIFRYLAAELAAMNIRMTLRLSKDAGD